MRFCVGLSKVHASVFLTRALESTTSAWKRLVRPLLQLTMRCLRAERHFEEMRIYLDLSVLISVHLNQGVFSFLRDEILPIAPVVLCLVFELFLKVLDSIFNLFELSQFVLSHVSLNSD